MQYQGKLNRYLHPPVQVLMFDSDEVKILVGLLIVAQIVGGIFWALPIIIPYWLFPYKREQNRGFFNHELYHLGLTPLYGYPSTEAKIFFE